MLVSGTEELFVDSKTINAFLRTPRFLYLSNSEFKSTMAQRSTLSCSRNTSSSENLVKRLVMILEPLTADLLWSMKTPIALIFIAALLGCQKAPPGNGGAQGPERNKITIASVDQPQSTLVLVAMAKGYFVAEGLEPQLLLLPTGKEALKMVVDNQADLATVAETPIMFSVLKDEKIFVVASIESSNENDAIVARRGAGIGKPDDLKGKRIGFTPGTTSEFFLDSLLTANGLTRREIQAVPLKPDEMQEKVIAKKVDAVSIWNYPRSQVRRQLGADGVVFFDREIYTETFSIAAQQDFVRKHPDTVKRFLSALLKAENFVAKYPDEAQAIVAAATKTDKDLVAEVWNGYSFHVGLDETLPITLEDETRWAMKSKLTDQTLMPDYRSYIHVDSLKALRPQAIGISR